MHRQPDCSVVRLERAAEQPFVERAHAAADGQHPVRWMLVLFGLGRVLEVAHDLGLLLLRNSSIATSPTVVTAAATLLASSRMRAAASAGDSGLPSTHS